MRIHSSTSESCESFGNQDLSVFSSPLTNRFKITFTEKMQATTSRVSWDSSVKHLYRLGLEKASRETLRKVVARTNRHRWKCEANDNYFGCELNEVAKQNYDDLGFRSIEIISSLSNNCCFRIAFVSSTKRTLSRSSSGLYFSSE
jgi:hypothetical protein